MLCQSDLQCMDFGAVTITTRITNDPIAGVYLLYEGKIVQNHGIVLFNYSTFYSVDCVTDSPH